MLTPAAASRRLGVPISTYRGYEYGTRIPSELVPKVCRVFSVTPNEFFNFPTQKPQPLGLSQKERKQAIHSLHQIIDLLDGEIL